MSNISRLMDAGIIAAGAALNPADQQVVDSLTDDEVSALISIKSKLTADFVQRNFPSSATPAPGTRTIGIVF